MENFIYDPKTKVEIIKNSSDNKKYYVYNISSGMENWSQRKSQYVYKNKDFVSNAYSFCNVHMITMALDYLGYLDKYNSKFTNIYPNLTRFPDKLAKFLFEDKRVLDFYKSIDPADYNDFISGKKNAFGPNEIHQVLSYGTNLFLGLGNVTQFSTNTSWLDIINDVVYDSLPVGISGKFSGLNHIVLLVGVAYSELGEGYKPSLTQIPDYLIIDDPFGKTYEYSKGLSGNDIWIPFSKCITDFKSLNNSQYKFSHRFVRPSDLGI